MNRLAVRVTLKAVIFLLLATPALAQDDGDFGSDGGDDFFSGEGFGNQGPAAGPKIDPLVDLKNWLARVDAPPLDKKQEKPLNKLYEKEVKAMAKSFEKRFGVPLESAIATQNQGRGRRGGGQRRINPEETAEIRKLTSQLMDKIIAALRMDQQGPLRRYQSEQIRISRLNRIIENMAIAGLPIKPVGNPDHTTDCPSSRSDSEKRAGRPDDKVDKVPNAVAVPPLPPAPV
jgi:hypothetical protein